VPWINDQLLIAQEPVSTTVGAVMLEGMALRREVAL